MCLETAREAVLAGRSIPTKAPVKTHERKNLRLPKRAKTIRSAKAETTNNLWIRTKRRSPDQRVIRPPPSKYNNFIDLTRSHEDVFLATNHIGVYKRPDSMPGDCSKRNQNKYCRYHKDVDHTIEECIMLKDEIEKLIREGYLRDCVANRSTKPCDDQGEAGPPREIRTIFDGPYFSGQIQEAQNRYL